METKPDRTWKLYNGDVEVNFWKEHGRSKHYYEVTDNGVTTKPFSVTKMIASDKSYLKFWYKKLLEKRLLSEVGKPLTVTQDLINELVNLDSAISEKAAQTGTNVHGWINDYINRCNPDMPTQPEEKNCITAFLAWEKQYSPVYVPRNKPVYSRKYGYVGEPDFICSINGSAPVVIDIKTSDKIYGDYYLQVASYTQAIVEEEGEIYETPAILRIPKDGTQFEMKQSPDTAKDFEAALGALTQVKRLYELSKIK